MSNTYYKLVISNDYEVLEQKVNSSMEAGFILAGSLLTKSEDLVRPMIWLDPSKDYTGE